MNITINSLKDVQALNLENTYRVEKLELQLIHKKDFEALGFKPVLIFDPEDFNAILYLDFERKISVDNNYKGYWQIYSRRRFTNLDNYQISEIRESVKQPNNFKVLNAKTIQKHLDYEIEVIGLCEIENIGNTENRTKSTNAIEAMESDKVKLHWWNDSKTEGTLSNDIFYLKFQIGSNGKLYSNITYRGENNLEAFAKLTK